jgi:hyperosmotically inducible periplasmic protein
MKQARVFVFIVLVNLLLLSGLPAMAAPATEPGLQSRANRASLAYVQERIRRKLASLPYYSVFDNLNFTYDGETVVLDGEVVRPTTRSDAERAVNDVEGVEQVVNRIEVLPLSSIDDRIRLTAYRRIFSHPQLSRYAVQPVPPIHIIVKNSRIKLEGVVASNSDKIVAGMLANQIPGVFNVENNLRIENPD